MTAATVDGRFDMGRVVQRTFQVLGRNFVPYFGLLLLPSVLGAVLGGGLGVLIALSGFRPGAGLGGLGLGGALLFGIGALAVVVLVICVTVIVQSAITYSVIGDLNGRKVKLREAFAAGRAVLLPVIGIALLGGLAIGAGLVFLLIPGIVLICLWFVVIPAQVLERPGVFGAFDRSAALTKGSRWRIFLLLLALGLIVIVVALLGLAVTGVLGPLGLIVRLLMNVLISMVSVVGAAVVYYELRSIKEGIAPQALDQVFA